MNKALSPLEISRGIKRSMLAGVFGSLFGVCIAPQFLTAFAIRLGATQLQIALLTSLPMFGLALQFVATILTQDLRERKPSWFWLATVHRLIWLAIAAIPFLMGMLGARLTVLGFLGLFFVTSVLGSMSVPLWFSWMADLVPAPQAGKFWARRVAIASLVNMLAIPLGWGIDHFSSHGLLPYVALFALAAIVGELDLLIHFKVGEPPVNQPGIREPLSKLIWKPFAHPDFRRLLFFTTSWSFAGAFADSFVVYFFLTQMGLSLSFIALAASSMWLMRWVMGKYWGFLADRFGEATVLRVCSSALVIWPLGLVFWGYSHPKLALLGIHLYMGFFNLGFESCSTGLMLSLSPRQNKSLFVSVSIGTAGLVGGLAPLLSGFFLEHSAGMTWLGGNLDAFQVVFLMGSVLRLATALLFPLRFGEMKATPPVLLVKRLIDANPFKVIHHSYVLNEGVDESQRLDAVHELADAGSDIATEQLIQAMRDPSLDVRRGAVRALSEIGEKSSLPALLAAASSPDAQIQPEAVEALGRFGERSVTPFLLKCLEEPALRLPALRSLGFLKDPAAMEQLVFWSGPKESVGVRATALEARCALGDESVLAPCLHFIRTCGHEIPRWQVAIALGRMVTAPVDYYSILQQELRVRGECVAQPPAWSPFPKWTREEQKKRRKKIQEMTRAGQAEYMEGHWKEAVRHFSCAAAVAMEISDGADASPSAILAGLQRTLEAVKITRSQWVLSLHMVEWFLQHEGDTAPMVQEEAVLAFALWKKTQGQGTN